MPPRFEILVQLESEDLVHFTETGVSFADTPLDIQCLLWFCHTVEITCSIHTEMSAVNWIRLPELGALMDKDGNTNWQDLD